MNKPEPVTKSALDYHECRNYLQDKYGYEERDYAGKFKGNLNAPYQDFWHFVLELAEARIGSYFSMELEWIEDFDDDDFRSIILNHYFNEFGNGEESIEFWVDW